MLFVMVIILWIYHEVRQTLNAPAVPVQISPTMNAQTVALFKEMGVTSDTDTTIASESQGANAVDLNRVSVALAKGANINAQCRAGYTPLMVAAMGSQHAALRFLLAHGAQINGRSRHLGTALSLATEQGDEETMTILLDHGADANTQDFAGLTALMDAVQDTSPAKVRLLLAHHADVNIRDNGNHTALWFAKTYVPKKPEIVTMLEQAGAKE